MSSNLIGVIIVVGFCIYAIAGRETRSVAGIFFALQSKSPMLFGPLYGNDPKLGSSSHEKERH
jgi:hypothetical protein